MINNEADLVVVTDGVSFAEIDYVDACHNCVARGVGEVSREGKRNAKVMLFEVHISAIEAFDVTELDKGVLPGGEDCRILEDAVGPGDPLFGFDVFFGFVGKSGFRVVIVGRVIEIAVFFRLGDDFGFVAKFDVAEENFEFDEAG